MLDCTNYEESRKPFYQPSSRRTYPQIAALQLLAEGNRLTLCKIGQRSWGGWYPELPLEFKLWKHLKITIITTESESNAASPVLMTPSTDKWCTKHGRTRLKEAPPPKRTPWSYRLLGVNEVFGFILPREVEHCCYTQDLSRSERKLECQSFFEQQSALQVWNLIQKSGNRNKIVCKRWDCFKDA